MKTAFLFPGQGTQHVGMARDLAEAIPAAAALFARANAILGFDLGKVAFEGPVEVLNTTAVSQPAIFVTSVALLEAVKTKLAAVPDVTAGLSLGEYTALYAAGLISFEDGLRLVQRRGQAMQAAADATVGGMVSLIGMDADKVRQLCNKASEGRLLQPANFNCPGQTVISGDKAACERAEMLASEFGATKAIRLEVAGAFHTPMMAPAAQALSQALVACKVLDPSRPKVLANVDACYYQTAQGIREGLAKQLTGAVLWQACMEKLIADGVEVFYEIGPGKVLTGLMRRIYRRANCVNISTLEALGAI